jgi:hypothetical protein
VDLLGTGPAEHEEMKSVASSGDVMIQLQKKLPDTKMMSKQAQETITKIQ